MNKFIAIVFLIVNRIKFSVRVNILERDFRHDLNTARLSFSRWTRDIAMLPWDVIRLIVRWIALVKLSAQIVLSFFFYSWRNSIYDGAARKFIELFSNLETMSVSRFFIIRTQLVF